MAESIRGLDAEVVEEAAHPFFNVVADRADRINVLASRVGQFPVLVALSGNERAGVPAAHGDDDVSSLDDFIGPGLRELAGDVDVYLSHGGDGGGVDLITGFGATRPCHPLVTG